MKTRLLGVVAILVFSGVVSPGHSSTYADGLNDPLGLATYAQGINDKDQIVGFYYTVDIIAGSIVSHPNGYLYSGGSYTTINNGTAITAAHGINDRGQIVGILHHKPRRHR